MPGAFFLASGEDAKNVASKFGVGETFPHCVQLSGRLGHGLVGAEAGILETRDSILELDPGTLAGGHQTRFGVKSRDALEGDAVERGVVPDESAHDLGADCDEVGGGVVGLGQPVDSVVEQLERRLGECSDEAVLGSEDAVDRPGRGLCFIGHGPHRKGIRSTLRDQSFRGGVEPFSGSVVVLLGTSHP